MNIKLPESADGEEVFTVCGRRCFCNRENRGGEKKESGGRGGEGKRWRYVRKREEVKGSTVLMEVWHKWRWRTQKQDNAWGQEVGLIAPGTQSHSINSPGRLTRTGALKRCKVLQ